MREAARLTRQSAVPAAGGFPYERDEGWGQGIAVSGLEPKEYADVAVAPDGRVHLLSRYPAAVIAVDDGGGVETVVGPELLSERPHGLTIAPDGSLFVVDSPVHAVRIFAADGRPLSVMGRPGKASDTGVDDSLPVPQWTDTVARAAGPFNHPTKVCFDSQGNILVADGYGNARVHCFSPDAALAASWGAPGRGPGEFRLPHSITALAAGRLAVVDRENDRIQIFGTDGGFRQEWPSVLRPTALVERADGSCLVACLPWQAGESSHALGTVTEATEAGIALLDRHGARQGWWTGGLIAPHGLAIGPDGSVYVAEVSFSFTRTVQPRAVHRLEPAPGL
jgi:sugar lactone lactonase YvrE